MEVLYYKSKLDYMLKYRCFTH